MKIIIRSDTVIQDDRIIEYLIEREQGQYNNIVETVILPISELVGLSEDEIKTLGYLKIKPTAVRVFAEIEPLSEIDNPVDFELVPSVPKRIQIMGSNLLYTGDTAEYQATIYDQYGQTMDIDLTWNNKTIIATEIDNIVVSASFGNLLESFVVNIVEKPRTKEELLQELVDQLIIDNLNMQQQIDQLILTSLGV